ncbi:hypothetical protein B5T_02540 [Alloalcanivorax dieselolei B5]|uniref:Uncharacterized protein n=1 Tax=Alcanivorax dieselolei (strain DSM 16502 / CGMCC 1.3690 / MCCC 1A00001 / B-5) TaxID=930169 RepID=K0CGK0_ALCDB|nr:hypothetical protein B5T_02540 [Alloalcanivorax dieselolei B5]
MYSGPGPYTGAFGEIDVNVVGSDLRINNVVYDNSTFSFDDALLPSDCTVEGDLVLDNGETLEIF